jgi:hypothetical protein
MGVYANWAQHLVDIEAGKDLITSTRGHMFWEAGEERWVPARTLGIGMRLYSVDRDVVAVESTRTYKAKSATYNLEVAQAHNFFVGAAGVLVHNDDGESTSNFASAELKSAKIYEVFNTRTGDVIYVGKTTQRTVQNRFSQHLADKPHWANNPDLDVREIHRGNWTDYETAVWEKHFIDERSQRFALENDPGTPPISQNKYNQFKHLHAPC